jgi:hypothetical protein
VKSPALIKRSPAQLGRERPGKLTTGRADSPAEGLQASLAQRLNEPASVSQLLPLVLAKTLMIGFGLTTLRKDGEGQP